MSSLPAPASSEEQFKLTPAVQGIIAINLVVMFLQLTTIRYSYTSEWLGFDASRVPSQWWSVVTYSLVHTGVGHLLANLYALYLFGPRLERSWSATGGTGSGAKRFVWFYLLCALGGVAFDMLFIRQGVLTGSSAAVLGVMTAYVMQWPNDEVYFLFVLPMRAKTLAVGLIAFNVLVGFAATGPGGSMNVVYFAHLGGMHHRIHLRPDGGVDGNRAGPSARGERPGRRRAAARDSAESSATRARRRSGRHRRQEQSDRGKRAVAVTPSVPAPRSARRRAGSRARQDLAARHRESHERRAQGSRRDVEASPRPLIPEKKRAERKSPPGCAGGRVPPRRSRGGDDRRIAPAHCQYVARYTRRQPRLFPCRSRFSSDA